MAQKSWHRKRHLVLYSGGQEQRNRLIHESLLNLALRRAGTSDRVRGGVHMTYIPFTSEGAATFFARFKRRYRAFGGTHFRCLPADSDDLAFDSGARKQAAKQLLDSDIVYLAGGNTFHYLLHLRRSGLLRALQTFARRGGVVAGLSAGAHLMTPHIALAGYPSFDCDENDVGLGAHQLGALGLVDFEFFPHYRNSARYRETLRSYSKQSRYPVYACRDGCGIVIEGDRFIAHGDVWLFDRGQSRKICG